MRWFIRAYEKYGVFKGRASRQEFWWFLMYYYLFPVVLTLLFAVLQIDVLNLIIPLSIYSLASTVPALALMVRRLHDIDKSGYWLFISFIPVVGIFYLYYLLAQKGEIRENKYGLNPTNYLHSKVEKRIRRIDM